MPTESLAEGNLRPTSVTGTWYHEEEMLYTLFEKRKKGFRDLERTKSLAREGHRVRSKRGQGYEGFGGGAFSVSNLLLSGS